MTMPLDYHLAAFGMGATPAFVTMPDETEVTMPLDDNLAAFGMGATPTFVTMLDETEVTTMIEVMSLLDDHLVSLSRTCGKSKGQNSGSCESNFAHSVLRVLPLLGTIGKPRGCS